MGGVSCTGPLSPFGSAFWCSPLEESLLLNIFLFVLFLFTTKQGKRVGVSLENKATLYRTEKHFPPQNRPKIGEKVTKNRILALFGLLFRRPHSSYQKVVQGKCPPSFYSF